MKPWTNREAFEVFAAKGCVNNPMVIRKADRAYRQIEGMLLLEERDHLRTAISHAFLHHSRTPGWRGEFDEVCQEVRIRLGYT